MGRIPALEPRPAGRLVRDSWRPFAMYGTQARVARLIRRLTLTAATLLLLVWLLYLLLRPFVHPNTFMVFLVASEVAPGVAEPAPFPMEDYVRLAPLEAALKKPPDSESRIPLVPLSTPNTIAEQLKAIDSWRVGRGEALIVYVKSYGLMVDGEPYLVCDDYFPRLEAEGVYPVADLLQQLRRLKAGTKLIVLDAGQPAYDRRLGVVGNDFPRAVAAATKQLNDPNLWVMLSYSSLQAAESSPALQRSIFGYMFARGMMGEADLNQDQQIAIDELSIYLRCSVDQWTRHYRADDEGQLPMLVRGVEAELEQGEFPLLISVASISQEKRETDVAEVMALAQSSKAQAEVSRSVQNHLSYIVEEKRRRLTSRFRPGYRAEELLSRAGGTASRQVKTAVEKVEPEAPPDAAAEEGAPPPAEQAANAAEAPLDAADAELDADSVEINLQYQPIVRQLLGEMWTFRDQLLDPTAADLRIVDYAPDLWREFQWQLLRAEQEHRSGVAANQIALAESLRDLKASLEGLVSGAAPRQRRVPNVIDRARARRPHYDPRGELIYSLALAERLEQFGIGMAADDRTAIAAFREAIGKADRQSFDAWLAQGLSGELRAWNELRFARRLGEQFELPWELIRQAIQTRLLAERVASHPLAGSPWFGAELKDIDALRAASERLLFDRLGDDWQQRAGQMLDQAESRYRAANDRLEQLQQGIALRNELLAAAPAYVEWHAASAGDSMAPSFSKISQLLRSLQQFSELLEQRDSSSLALLLERSTHLLEARSQLTSGLTVETIAEMIESPVAGDAHRLESLLAVALPPAAVRRDAIDASVEVEARLMGGFTPSLELFMVGRSHRLGSARLVHLVDQCRLEVALAELAIAGTAAANDRLAAIRRHLQTLESAVELKQSDVTDDAAFWQTLRAFSEQLTAVYRDLPARIEQAAQSSADLTDWSSRAQRVESLRRAERTLRMVDPRDLPRVDSGAFMQRLTEIAWFDHLAWQQSRFLQQLADASPAERSFLAQAAESYRRIAAEIPRQPLLAEKSPPGVEISGPEFVSLAASAAGEAVISIRKRAAASNDVWLLLDYDPQLIEVQTPADRVIYPLPDLLPQLRTMAGAEATRQRMLSFAADGDSPLDSPPAGGSDSGKAARYQLAARYPARPDLADYPKSLAAPPGDTANLVLRLRRLRGGANDTRLILKAINGDTYVRHEIAVRLPGREAIELLAGDSNALWDPTADGLVVYPLPNRSSSVSFLLKNNGDRSRVVDVEWLAPAQRLGGILPLGEQTADVAHEILGRMGNMTSWKKVTGVALPAGGRPVPIAPPAPPPMASANGAAESAPAADAPPATGVSPAANPSDDIVLDHGLLVTLTDTETGKVSLRHVKFAPQRPRRYVQASVGYNSSTQQIEIRVSALNRFSIPPDGIRVECTFAEPLPPGAEARLTGSIQQGNPEARMFADLPPTYRREMTAMIHVDGYPRAFLYKVPIGPQANDLPEWADVFRVWIEKPASGSAYQAPLESVPLEVRVDAPRGAFPPDLIDDYLEVGIDVDRDREFRDEKTYRFQSDRLVVIKATDLHPNGALQLETRVSDFAIDLPADGLSNAVANLLARLSVGPHVAWSESVPVVLDAAPPKIDRVEMNPGRVVEVGSEVEISVWASDADLSGAAKVEIGLGSPSGEFAANPPPVEAELIAGFRWRGQLKLDKLAPGFHTVLIRATDLVGNVGGMHKESLQVVPPGSVPPPPPAATGATITGTVKYGDEPFAGATVELVPLDQAAAKIDPVTADDGGRFTFKNVPAGEYTLTAQGRARNKLRKAEQAVTVEQGNTGLQLFSLQPR